MSQNTPFQAEWNRPQVTVRTLKVLANAGSLRALADVEIAGAGEPLVIHGCRLVQQTNQEPWVSPPQECWTGQDGQKRWSPRITLPKSWAETITRIVVECWYDFPDGFDAAPTFRGEVRRRAGLGGRY